MPYPSNQNIELPLLKVITDAGGEVSIANREVFQRIADYFPQITTEELVRRKRASETVWQNRVQWVRLKLVKNGQIADWRSVGRQGVWRITEKGRRRLEKEWAQFEAHASDMAGQEQTSPIEPEEHLETHALVQKQLQEIGETLGKFATTEYRESMYRYDVVWKEADYMPRVTHCFEVQHHGNVVEALAKLKHAHDIWGGHLFIVITDGQDRQKARQLLTPYFSGTFHEIAQFVTVLTPNDVSQIHATMSEYSEIIRLFVSR